MYFIVFYSRTPPVFSILDLREAVAQIAHALALAQAEREAAEIGAALGAGVAAAHAAEAAVVRPQEHGERDVAHGTRGLVGLEDGERDGAGGLLTRLHLRLGC